MSITKDIRVNFKKFYTKLQGKSQTTWRTSVLDCSAAQFAANASCKHRSLNGCDKTVWNWEEAANSNEIERNTLT